MQPCGYILASRRNGTLYIGVTSDLSRRVWEHKADLVPGFTKEYGVHTLVYAEFHPTIACPWRKQGAEAILREKRLKAWRRTWKLALIEEANPTWRDLYDDIV